MLQHTKLFPIRLVIVPVLIAAAALVSACVVSPPPPGAVQQNAPPTPKFSTTQVPNSLQAAPDMSPLVAASDCPGLDSALAQIIGSPDPIAQARQLQFTVKDDRIQVVLVLAQPDSELPARASTSRSGDRQKPGCKRSCHRANCARSRKAAKY